MIIKGKFKEVLGIRPFQTREGQNRYAVEYLIEETYTRRDGSTGAQQYIAETYYDQQPNLGVGAVSDPNVYEFELFFKVRTAQDGRKWQSITIVRVAQPRPTPGPSLS